MKFPLSSCLQMYNRIKSDMEKKCQAAAEKLKADLAAFVPNLKFLNDLTDYEQIFQYNVVSFMSIFYL